MLDDPAAANSREERFFKTVAATHSFFGLFDGTGWFNRELDGERMVPFWSSPDEAARASAGCPGYAPKEVTVREFIDVFADQLAECDIWIAVNPTTDWTGNELPASRFTTLLAGRGR